MEPEGSDHDEYGVPNNSLSRRAGVSQIRCDKRSPCSNCRSSNVICRSTGEGQKPHQQRRRVLISTSHPTVTLQSFSKVVTYIDSERKIDLIEERLGGIEKALQELVTHSRSNGPGPPKFYGSSQTSPLSSGKVDSPVTKSDQANLKGPGYTSNPAIEQHDPSSGFEGNSSLAAHSAYAREFLESAFSHSTPEVLSSPKINEALSSLRHIVEMQNKQREIDPQRAQFPNQETRVGARCDVRQLELPPLTAVLTILKSIKENPPSSFSGYIPFFGIDYFIEKCRDVYISRDEYSDAAFIVANLGLYNIFIELSFSEKEPTTRNEYHRYVEMCKDAVEAALANLNILMPATHEYIVALTLGAMHGIEIAKPSLSWTLASTAIHMCQTLGYHRISSMESDPSEVQKEKQCLFWSVYTILNMMSLRLGRASVIQDFDISLPSPFETFPSDNVWGHVNALWTRQAMLQNKVYTTLYSPAALNQPESVRLSHARSLAGEMNATIIEPFELMMSSDLGLCEVDILYLQCDKVSRLAMLTLIYRAIPAPAGTGSSSTFIPECVETARAALEHHQMAILVSPFVPFIVIFCHIIATSDSEDLALLEDFIASLQVLCSISQSVDRLHNICSVFGTVARLYVEAKTRSKAGENPGLASVGQEFDVYLSALGLAPGSAITSGQGYCQPAAMLTSQAGVPESAPRMAELAGPAMQLQGQSQEAMSEAEMMQTAQLGNWFSGNQYMMGLLEEDLVQFNPNI
ncbi:transcriptional regulator family: Fungal Specific TF [Penicillium longicatenatum]|nr:transcriptional regulator family: Fungal Specific TF [Penicillium longicatenatum]